MPGAGKIQPVGHQHCHMLSNLRGRPGVQLPNIARYLFTACRSAVCFLPPDVNAVVFRSAAVRGSAKAFQLVSSFRAYFQIRRRHIRLDVAYKDTSHKPIFKCHCQKRPLDARWDLHIAFRDFVATARHKWQPYFSKRFIATSISRGCKLIACGVDRKLTRRYQHLALLTVAMLN